MKKSVEGYVCHESGGTLDEGAIVWVTWQEGPAPCVFRERVQDPLWDHCIVTHAHDGIYYTRGIDTHLVHGTRAEAQVAWEAWMNRLYSKINAEEHRQGTKSGDSGGCKEER